MDRKRPPDTKKPKKGKDTKAAQRKNLRIVRVDPDYKIDWSMPHAGVVEEGRGIVEYKEKLTNIIIRYYSYQRLRYEKIRYFAEINVTKKEKFILDGMELIPLIQNITDVAWDIIELRKKMKKYKTNLTIVKSNVQSFSPTS